MSTIIYCTALLSVLLEEIGVQTNQHEVPGGFDLTFTYSLDGRCFTGVARVDEDLISIEFWLRHYPRCRDTISKKLVEINESPHMIENDVRWMRFLLSEKHLGIVAQLNVSGYPPTEAIMETRLQSLIQLMKAEFLTLVSL